MIPDPFACAEIGCVYLDADTLEGCKKRACPFAYQRGREEDQVERDRKDAEARGHPPRSEVAGDAGIHRVGGRLWSN